MLLFKTWDLVKLTQNYLKLLLHYVNKGDSGLLIHCISGWDRTPLFISLLRLSLWADGSIHTSLTPLEILYLTVAYDWFLFGHNLPDRIGKGEEIFFFCFNFLKYITSEEFSVTPSTKAKTVSRTNSECNIVDDVLLGAHIHPAASNTSINSTSSANSTKSSIDNPPMCFPTDTADDEPLTPHGLPVNIPSCTSRLAPVTKVSTDKCGSSPMAVPCSRWREPKPNSPAYGSWQIISGTGSFRGSTSSYESPRSSTSEHSFNGHGCYTQYESHEETPRKQRLDAVRRIFLSVYCSGTGCRTFPEANGANSAGGISGLLENFAEKVGFRGSGIV
ncbi:Myotubularin-related protein 14 [Lamellibrachia satsuma]|nr:Myotubularin-related protein 14 [Lamellibrachia satsuma]